MRKKEAPIPPGRGKHIIMDKRIRCAYNKSCSSLKKLFYIHRKESMKNAMTRKREIDLTQGRIFPQMVRFFVPIWCGIVFQQIYVTADAVIISKVVGESALAAVGCTTTFINLLIGFFTGIGSGATVVIAQYFGAREHSMVRKATHTALVLAFIIGLCFLILGLLISPWLLHLLQTPADIFDMALRYLRVYSLGMIFSVVYNMGSGILRAVGDARRPVYILVATVVINIFLDLLFTAVIRLGVGGAALATILSQAIAMILVLACLYRERELPIQLRFRELRPDFRLLWRITRIGLPTGIQSTMFDLSNLLIQASVNFFGTSTITAWTAYSNISLLFWMSVSAMGTTMTTFTGQNFGAGNLDRLRRGVRTGIALAAAGCLIITLLTILFRYPLTHLFATDPEVVQICIRMILFLTPTYITYMCIELFSGVIRGAGEALVPMIITGSSICLFRVVWVVWILPLHNTLDMICLSYPISWCIGTVAFLIYYKKGKWLTKRLPAAEPSKSN